MMTNLFLNFSQNYGVLIIAAITFCIVQALSYLFRQHVATVERRASVIHMPARAGTQMLVREELDRSVKELAAAMRKREAANKAARGKLQARFKGRAVSASYGAQSAAYVGSLRHGRKTRLG